MLVNSEHLLPRFVALIAAGYKKTFTRLNAK